VSEEETRSPPTKRGGGFWGRILGRGDPESSDASPRSGRVSKLALDLPDIQGFIVRGYRMRMVRHFLLTVANNPTSARKLLGRLVNGDESDVPQITTAEDWHVGFELGPGDNPADAPRRKPDYCLNVGITWPGLLALEIKERVPTLSFKSFGAFTAGAAARAKHVGDTGASAPEISIGADSKVRWPVGKRGRSRSGTEGIRA
jgi:hypothetical protein